MAARWFCISRFARFAGAGAPKARVRKRCAFRSLGKRAAEAGSRGSGPSGDGPRPRRSGAATGGSSRVTDLPHFRNGVWPGPGTVTSS